MQQKVPTQNHLPQHTAEDVKLLLRKARNAKEWRSLEENTAGNIKDDIKKLANNFLK